jgi:thiamine pyrophosphate-dependent acetolactate synthase large subunit-like protein
MLQTCRIWRARSCAYRTPGRCSLRKNWCLQELTEKGLLKSLELCHKNRHLSGAYPDGERVVPDDCIYSLFAIGIHSRDHINCGIDGSDLVITVGYNIAEYSPYLWNGKLGKKIINVYFVGHVPDRYFNPTVEIIGDVTSSIRELASSIQEKRELPFFEKTRYFIEKKINATHPKIFSFATISSTQCQKSVRKGRYNHIEQWNL